MKATHVPDGTRPSNLITQETATTVPPPAEDVSPRSPTPARGPHRNLAIVLSVLGVLIIAAALAVLATDTGPDSSVTPAPSSAVGTTPTGLPSAAASGSQSSSTGLPRGYDVVRLAKLSGSTEHPTLGFAVNNAGQVVGQSDAANGHAHPVLWHNGTASDLGVLPSGGNDELGIARDVNDRGDAVGLSNTENGQHAVLWRNGQIIDLGTLNGNPTAAHAINDNGQIVGTTTTPTGELRGFLWDNGRMRDLGIDGGVIPRDINNKGQVVGSLDFGESGARQQAFLWENGVVKRLGAPGTASSAEAVNDRGEIVGRYVLDAERGSHPVRWYQGSMTDLGLLAKGTDGAATAINAQGQIVGVSNVAPHSIVEHAFLWWRGALHDLTPTGVPQEAAHNLADINNQGQIVAGAALFTPRG